MYSTGRIKSMFAICFTVLFSITVLQFESGTLNLKREHPPANISKG